MNSTRSFTAWITRWLAASLAMVMGFDRFLVSRISPTPMLALVVLHVVIVTLIGALAVSLMRLRAIR